MRKHKFKIFKIILLISLFAVGCKNNSVSEPVPGEHRQSIKILYTNDEHGWMEKNGAIGGAAGLMNLWKNSEGYSGTGAYLILSGGDMWTGPAISTWFEGESMAQVMNNMNYSASAIGNHEFDFGLDKLVERKNKSAFPFLSANIKEKSTGTYPGFCEPYTIKTVNGIKVGIIGLTSVTIPEILFPKYTANLNFISYEEALNEVVPKLKGAGAELLLIISHMGSSEMSYLAPIAKKYGIKLIAGGHSHEAVTYTTGGVTLIESGSKMEYYTSVSIDFDSEKDSVISIKAELKSNTGGGSDAAIESIVNNWKTQTDNALSEVIGYSGSGLAAGTTKLYNLIMDSWLYAFPYADISISNTGSVRQQIFPGNITLSSIVGVLPFENEIVELELTGAQVISLINQTRGGAFLGGINSTNGNRLRDGTPINLSAVYKVITTDYYYLTESLFKQYDASPTYTYINFRQPVINYIKSLNTSQSNPLENYLDDNPRQSIMFKNIFVNYKSPVHLKTISRNIRAYN